MIRVAEHAHLVERLGKLVEYMLPRRLVRPYAVWYACTYHKIEGVYLRGFIYDEPFDGDELEYAVRSHGRSRQRRERAQDYPRLANEVFELPQTMG